MKRAITISLISLFVAGCLAAGVWQLGRLGERRTFNERLLVRAELPIVDVADAVASDGEEAAYRTVTARGTYDAAREVVLLSRSFRGISGHHVITPLVLDDGRGVLVDRGWIPLTFDEPPIEGAEPPDGPVALTGTLVPSQERGRFGPRTTAEGPHSQVFRVDIDVLASQVPYEVLPVFLQLEEQEPATATEYPIAVPMPPLGEGPHLFYAIQWFLFAAAATVTSVAVARRRRAAHQPGISR